jgi:DDE family transposase
MFQTGRFLIILFLHGSLARVVAVDVPIMLRNAATRGSSFSALMLFRGAICMLRNGEGGTVPSYNLQLLTDTQHGLVVNVEATTDPIDYRQLEPAIERCKQALGCKPRQLVADGDYTNHASVWAAAAHGVDFYGSWQDSWRPGERDAQGRDRAFQASAFPYDAEREIALPVLREKSCAAGLC